MEKPMNALATTARTLLAKLMEALDCPQRCKETIDRFVMRPSSQGDFTISHPQLVTDACHGNENEARYLLSGACVRSTSEASSRAMQEVVETVFSKVIQFNFTFAIQSFNFFPSKLYSSWWIQTSDWSKNRITVKLIRKNSYSYFSDILKIG